MTSLPVVAQPTDNPWLECSAHFIRKIESHSGSADTAALYWYYLSRFLGQRSSSPERVTPREIDNFMNEPNRRTGKPISAGARNNRLAILSSFYRFASSFIPTGYDAPLFQKPNPCASLIYSAPTIKYRAFAESDLPALFAEIRRDTPEGARDYAYFCCLLLTSRRRAEILRLTWGDLFTATITEGGKPRTMHMFRFRQKGHGLAWESQELPQVAYDAIVAYVHTSGRASTIAADDPIFIGHGHRHKPGEPVVARQMLRRLQDYCTAAGIDSKCLHSFRHSSIQLRLANGDDMLDVMKISGHKGLDSFYRYARGLQGVTDPGADKLQARLSFLEQSKVSKGASTGEN